MAFDERCASWGSQPWDRIEYGQHPLDHFYDRAGGSGYEHFLVRKYQVLHLEYPRAFPSGWLLPGCLARIALACCEIKSAHNPVPGDLTCDPVSGSSRYACRPGQTIHSDSDRVAHEYRPIPQRRCHFSSGGGPVSPSGPHSPFAGDGFAVARRVSRALEVASPLFQNSIMLPSYCF